MDGIIVSIEIEDEAILITKGNFCLAIYNYRFVFSKLSTSSEYKYRIFGKDKSSMDVTEQELDFIYSEFKRYNN